ncbi:LysR family transcriptional regulator [Streptomyces sp. NPDC021020]|uniref:LysR family transcriptional regulator n=1 Tax=Streptomyces sp. NPDC021020 TaxID=3365109 RepID=UPI00379A1656
MLERHELEAFLTLAEELHFGRTAERLHLTTARVSQTIAKLERRVGAPLFARTSRRVELTPVGRRLVEEVRPAWARIAAAYGAAVEAGRGLTGTLGVAFAGAAGGQLLAGAAELFREQAPGCEVRIREVLPADVVAWLRDGEADLVLASLPVDGPGIASGPVLIGEARMLAVPAGHPFARRASLSLEDLARVTLLRLPDHAPRSLQEDRAPHATPAGRPVAHGPAAATFHELLTLVGAGRGALVVGAQTRRYYARPDVAYVPFRDAPPVEWALHWRADAATARVRAFADAVHTLLDR